MNDIIQDLRYALRALRNSPGFAVVAITTLALGIGATAAIFSLVSATLLSPLPLKEPERLVVVYDDFTPIGGPDRASPALADYAGWKARSSSFEDMAALINTPYNLTGAGDPVRLPGARTTANLFTLIGLQPLLGRTLLPDDEGPVTTPVVVISERLWRERFAADPGLIGRTIDLDGLKRTVIGVVPPDFRFPYGETAVWVPASFSPEELASRTSYNYEVVARLKPELTLGEAQAEMSTIMRAMQEEVPGGGRIGVTVAGLQEQLARTARPTLLILLAAVGTVLLITCANVANLLLARGANRGRELAIRKALGAGDGRVVRQLLTESAVLALASVVLGAALSTLSFGYLSRLIPASFHASAQPNLDWRVLTFTGAVTVLTVLLFGAGPALLAARRDSNDTLKKAVGTNASPRARRTRNGIVVGEIAMTMVLLVAAGILLRSYAAVLAVDAGFRPDNLLIAETQLSATAYARSVDRSEFYRRVLERVSALPGVTSAGYINAAPLVFKGGRAYVSVEGRQPAPADFPKHVVSNRAVTAGYFETLGVPLVSGRVFDARDDADAAPVAIINQAMARLHWPDEDPVGRRVRFGPADNPGPWLTVVGVVDDVRQMGLHLAAEPEVYVSSSLAPDAFPFFWPRHLLVRTDVDPSTLINAVRNAVWEVDAAQPVSSIRPMREVFDNELTNRSTQLALIGSFAALALLLAAVGVYGVLSYAVAQRTAELGLRMALGAPTARVVTSVVRSALVLAFLGVAIGLVAAVGLTRFFSSFVYGVSTSDPLTLAAVAALLLVVTIVASYVPARRAASVDPVLALRGE